MAATSDMAATINRDPYPRGVLWPTPRAEAPALLEVAQVALSIRIEGAARHPQLMGEAWFWELFLRRLAIEMMEGE